MALSSGTYPALEAVWNSGQDCIPWPVCISEGYPQFAKVVCPGASEELGIRQEGPLGAEVCTHWATNAIYCACSSQHTPSSPPIRACKPAERIFSLPSSANYPITQNQSRILGLLLLLALMFFINRTKIGLAIRAISQNIEAASLMGINPDFTIMVTFFVGSLLAGIAGILIGSYFSVVKFDIGLMGGIKGFSAAVVGGLGNFNGAILGGLTLGFVETFASAYIPGGTPYKDVYAFIIVIFFLVFRPSGLIGEKVYEKV
ncbi:MAG: branched-chain amino acid ABC transporter permease [Deltaproteobacteria bacterium]|nr:branched-chain amino acid ABC transporter permease [Deltaproteobacteria bacterium]